MRPKSHCSIPTIHVDSTARFVQYGFRRRLRADKNHIDWVNTDTLYNAWTSWRSEEGWTAGTTKALFGRELSAACPQVIKHRNHEQGMYYSGIALAEAASPPVDAPVAS